MRKKLFIAVAIFIASGTSFGQQGDGGAPKGTKLAPSEFRSIDTKLFSEPDIQALIAEDAEVDGRGVAPWRFGFNNYTELNTTNSGTWIELPNGDKIWMLKLICDNALTINLTFDKTVIPEGNELYIYDENKSFILGKFTDYHLYEGKLGAELVPGNVAIVEYYVPKRNKANIGNIQVSTVTHGYRTAEEFRQKAFGGSGNCNMNVNCPDGSLWTNQKNSAVMLVSGSSGFCSAALINNTFNDGKPYVLTANHCYSDPATWIFRFNWQADGCVNPGVSPSFESLSGAILRARRTPSDMCLVEITGGLIGGTVPESYNPFFAGWNNSNTPPTSTVGIHHPSGDIKKISFDDNPAVTAQAMGSSEPESSWEVVWDRNTTTEGGSSGSPLFDQNGRIIGQLWGGGASCSNLTAPDYYGRVHNSWEPVGSDQTNQLKYWLDPSSSGVEFIDGLNLGTPHAALDGALSYPQGTSGIICGGEVTPSMTLINLGSTTLTSATIVYNISGGANQQYDWTGSLELYQSEVINLSPIALADGDHVFYAEVTLVNGGVDENATNNSVSSSFSTITEGVFIEMNLQLDCYGSETSWVLETQGGAAVYQGGPYSDNWSSPQLINENWCLANECYNLIINDDYGDGIGGGGWCSTTGYVLVRNEANDTLTQLTTEEADFGSTTTLAFCTDGTPVGISKNELTEQMVQLYPNPTSGEVSVSMSFEGEKTITVYGLDGTFVDLISTNEKSVSLDLASRSNGVYLAHIQSDYGVIVKRIIKN